MTLSAEEHKRYNRQIALGEVGIEGQEKMAGHKVVIIGCGGLGVPCAQYLAAAGIGHITLVDFDVVIASNLPRQPLYNPKDIGKKKALVLAARLKEQNPHIEIDTCDKAFSHSNALNLVNSCDIVVDCTDNMESRYLINDACVLANKPFVSAGIYRYEGMIGVFNYKSGPSYRCLYPEPRFGSTITSCEDNGVLGVLPGLFGVYQASEVIKMILKMENVLSDNIMIINILNNTTSTFKIEKDQGQFNMVLSRGITTETIITAIDKIEDLEALIENESINLVDVRNQDELPIIDASFIVHLPLSELEKNHKILDRNKPIVVFCNSGRRSTVATQKLAELGFERLYNFTPGATALTDSHLTKEKAQTK